ncbi:MAG: sodium/proton-translocating pyrophosphatase, partial [Eubacteriales bacterium]|nr:sodium/proton-translocating pyrophosphatase [Eubacteriales bacterium]
MAYLSVVCAIAALVFAYMMASYVTKQPVGNERMADLASAIHGGAKAFLFAEYRVLVVFIIVLFALIAIGISPITAICFLAGALFSIAAGYIGMDVATKANVRTANAARDGGMTKALNVAFRGGSVMGMCVAGLGLLGTSIVYIATGDPNVMMGFSLGASSIALFARVGGGIYTKAA